MNLHPADTIPISDSGIGHDTLDLHTRIQPGLRLKRCFSDSFSVWTHHLPLLFVASILVVLVSVFSATFLMGSMYAGLLVILLKGMRGDSPALRDLFSEVRHCFRFFAITLCILLLTAIGFALLLAPFLVFGGQLKRQIKGQIDLALLIQQVESSMGIPFPLLIIAGAVAVGLFLLMIPGIMFGVRCFYMVLLAADRDVQMDEAFVESRKAVQRYGFRKHFILIGLALLILFGSSSVTESLFSDPLLSLEQVSSLFGADRPDRVELDGSMISGILFLLVQPFVLGLFVSAYRQTLEAEATRVELYRKEFAEMRDELQTAHDMQMGLLPKESPNVEGYSLDGECITANSVGGDYFHYRWLDEANNLLAVVVADVSGKAMEAAVTALRFNEMLRYECKDRVEPAEILDGLNSSLEGQIEASTFITCCIVVVDLSTGEAKVANAGHCLPYQYIRETGDVEAVNVIGFPLGLPPIVRPDEPYETLSIRLEMGDSLILYSDGVVEAQNSSREFYEEERLEKLFGSTAQKASVTDLIETIVEDVRSHIGSAPRTDDITVVAMKRE